MKRFYLLMLALLTLTLQAATVKIGYFKSDGDYFWAYDGFGQPPVDMKFGAAIRITPDMYANYLGADIKGIRIGWSNPDYSSPCTIFMRSELNGKENILTGSGTLAYAASSQTMMGKYTTIYFDNADGMKLTEDLGTFYVGYYAEKVKQGTFAIATSYPSGQAGSAYLWGDIESNYDADGNEIWEDDSDKATLCVDLIVEGTFTNKVQPLGLITYPTITEGKADDGLLSIKNCGTNSVNKLTFEYKMGDEVKTQTVSLGTTIESGMQKRITVPVWALGDGVHTLRITKVGSYNNGITDEVEYQTTKVPADVAAEYQRTSLVEFYQSENVYYVPRYYDEYFLPGYERYSEKLNLMAQHLDDQWMLGDDEATRLMLDLSDNDSSAVIIPAITVDRTANLPLIAMGLEDRAPYHSIILPEFADYCYEPHLARPTFARLEATTAVADDKSTVTVSVSGHIAEGVLAPGRRLHLTVSLLEDGVYTDSQEQDELGKGEYHHQNLQRACLTHYWGDKLDVESGDFTATFTTDLYPEEWNLQKMRVVAFLNRTPEDGDRWNRDVINSTSCPLLPAGEDGINHIAADAPAAATAVYDLQGRRLHSADDAKGGIYIQGGRKMVRK